MLHIFGWIIFALILTFETSGFIDHCIRTHKAFAAIEKFQKENGLEGVPIFMLETEIRLRAIEKHYLRVPQ